MHNPGNFQNVPFLLHPELMEIKAEGWACRGVYESPSVPPRPGLTLAGLQQWPQMLNNNKVELFIQGLVTHDGTVHL